MNLDGLNMPKTTNILGATVAITFFISAILVFASRLAGMPQAGYWIGIFELLLAIPLMYLVVTAPGLHRPMLYYVQIGCMLAWLVVELLLDYLLKIDFRSVRWLVISYVILFFAGSGGLLGIATQAGRSWGIPAIILFLVMAVLTFVQRGITGL